MDFIFKKTDRIRDNIQYIIRKWQGDYTKNEVVNLTLCLVPNFILWAIWKERNRRIFQNKKLLAKRLVELIRSQLKEIVISKGDNVFDDQPSSQEAWVLKLLELDNLGMQVS